jgi:hypothetical protein
MRLPQWLVRASSPRATPALVELFLGEPKTDHDRWSGSSLEAVTIGAWMSHRRADPRAEFKWVYKDSDWKLVCLVARRHQGNVVCAYGYGDTHDQAFQDAIQKIEQTIGLWKEAV